MKNRIILFVFALITLPMYAQLHPKAAIIYNFNEKYTISEEAYNELQNVYDKTSSYSLPKISIRTGMDYQYHKASIYYDTTVWCKYQSGEHSFSPEEIRFEIGIRYNLTRKIALMANHVCFHPLQTQGLSHHKIYGGNESISISYGY